MELFIRVSVGANMWCWVALYSGSYGVSRHQWGWLRGGLNQVPYSLDLSRPSPGHIITNYSNFSTAPWAIPESHTKRQVPRFLGTVAFTLDSEWISVTQS